VKDDVVFCISCNDFRPCELIETPENKYDFVNEDFLLALALEETPIPRAEISHELCTHHCPHCGTCIIVEELNCRIFRCGAGLNPHATEEEGAKFALQKLGCGKQFRIDESGNAHKCTGM
jgi:hypothetical protein